MSRIGGEIFVKVDGAQYRAKGSWTVNLGASKREAIVGSDSVHGYKEMPQVAFIEGVITKTGDISMKELVNIKDATVTLDAADGTTYVLENAWFAGEGSYTSEEGEIAARFEGVSAEEIR